MENIINKKVEKFLQEEILWEYSPEKIIAEDVDDYDDNEYSFNLSFEVWDKKIDLACLYNSFSDEFKIQSYEEGPYEKFESLEFWRAVAMFAL